jgi:flavin-dependent dehydrogenase
VRRAPVDQGVDREGNPDAGFMPGMDIRAALTVVGDGPVGAMGRQLDKHFGLPAGHHQREWALGMKMVVDLPAECDLAPGTVIHTFGYPEPEIFGFFYVMPDRVATVGIFVPSWFRSPMRTSYRYLQHYMLHPYLWRHLKGGRLRSWGAKSLQESGKRGEPFLAGEGYARIGEGSGSTNVLTGSGVDEAWTTGCATGRSGGRAAAAEIAAQPREPGADLRGAAPRELGGRGRPRRGKGARRFPRRRHHWHDRHGAGRVHARQASRSAESRGFYPIRKNTTAQDSA